MATGKYAQPTQQERELDRQERKDGAADRLREASGKAGLAALQASAAQLGYVLVPADGSVPLDEPPVE